jgi:G2/mitotic-specific cyclin 1/2
VRECRYQTQTRQLGKYLAEIVLVEERLVGTPPSLLAAAAMWLARLALGEGDWLPASSTAAKDEDEDATVTAPKRAYVLWTPTLVHYATYAEAELLPAARHMLRYVLQPVRHESFYRKWAGKRNMKVSLCRCLCRFRFRFRFRSGACARLCLIAYIFVGAGKGGARLYLARP